MLISNPKKRKDLSNLTLITGGARSGKSVFAEKLALSANMPVVYLATMQRYENDLESNERINIHRSRRPSDWTTIEEPLDLHKVISEFDDSKKICLVDCLSLWVTNILLSAGDEREALREKETALLLVTESLIAAMMQCPQVHFILVTNEVGAGIVPDNQLARIFRDALGTVNQEFARVATEVWLTCVGLPHRLKPPLSPLPPGVNL